MSIKPFRYGFSPISPSDLELCFSIGDLIRLDEGCEATPTVSLKRGDEYHHICTLRVDAQSADLDSDETILERNRRRIQVHLDEVFCNHQSVPTKIYRK